MESMDQPAAGRRYSAESSAPNLRGFWKISGWMLGRSSVGQPSDGGEKCLPTSWSMVWIIQHHGSGGAICMVLAVNHGCTSRNNAAEASTVRGGRHRLPAAAA